MPYFIICPIYLLLLLGLFGFKGIEAIGFAVFFGIGISIVNIFGCALGFGVGIWIRHKLKARKSNKPVQPNAGP